MPTILIDNNLYVNIDLREAIINYCGDKGYSFNFFFKQVLSSCYEFENTNVDLSNKKDEHLLTYKYNSNYFENLFKELQDSLSICSNEVESIFTFLTEFKKPKGFVLNANYLMNIKEIIHVFGTSSNADLYEKCLEIFEKYLGFTFEYEQHEKENSISFKSFVYNSKIEKIFSGFIDHNNVYIFKQEEEKSLLK